MRRLWSWIGLIVLLLVLAGCGRGGSGAQAGAVDQQPIRTPRPTFTPMPTQPTAVPAPTQPENAAATAPDAGQEAAPAAPAPSGARLVVTESLVNVRSGPGLDFEVITMVERGEEYDIISRSTDGEWWELCCVNNTETAWIIGQLVDTIGPVDSVPIFGQNTAGQATGQPAPAAGNFTVGSVRATINTALVNVREGPGTEFPVVTILETGQQYDVVAGNPERTWWQLCCVEGAEVWIIDEFVDLNGPASTVPIFGQDSGGQEETGGDPAAFTFDLVNQEQFAEPTTVRIYMFASNGSTGVEGYRLRVEKDGIELPVDTLSFGGQPGFTWPFQDARQRSQNWKAEFPGVDPAGTWEVQLLDRGGVAVGPVTTFTLTADDAQKELYVRYDQR